MKKITLMMLCIVFLPTFSHAQNFISNNGFEDALTTYTVDENSTAMLRRTINPESTQTENGTPTSSIVPVTAGMWVKKTYASNYIKAAVMPYMGQNSSTGLNFKITAGSLQSGLTDWHNCTVQQQLPNVLLNTASYTFSFWARVDDTANNQCNQLVAYLFDATNNVYLSVEIPLTGGTTGTFYTAKFDLPVFLQNHTSAYMKYVGLGLTATYNTSSATFYSGVIIDNLTLTQDSKDNLYPVNGNIGIGTPIPTQALSVTGRLAIATSGAVSNESYNGALMITRPQASGQYINLTRQNGSAWSIGTVYNSNTMGIGLATTSDAAFTAPFMNIDFNGKIGIGTVAPKSKLESVSGVNANPATVGTNQTGSALRLRGADNAVLDFGLNSGNTWLQASDQTNLGLKNKILLNPNGGSVGVGTGTVSPIGVFDVKTATNQHIQILNDVNGAYMGAAGIVSINDANSNYTPMGFFASNYYFGNGNIGIGKLPTNIKLDVGGSACVDTEFSIDASGADNNGIGGEIHIYNTAKTGVGEMSRWSMYNMNAGYGNSLQFWAYDNHNTFNHRVTFQDDGNVGIGVPHPNFKLDVDGDIQIINNRKIGYNLNDVFTYDTDKTMGHYSLGWFPDSKTISSGPALWMSGYGGIKFFTTGAQRITINHDGKVGIGLIKPDEFLATTPTDELLTVNGTIHAKEVKIDLNTDLADYVFKPTYKLMPLHEVEQYVKTNSHLPEIPSAAEVKKDGMSIGEMQNKLLQKVEELTLYVIEQQKTINKQSAKIDELEKKLK